jgi:hypothetical protein
VEKIKLLISASFDQHALFGFAEAAERNAAPDGRGNSVLHDDSISPISDHARTGKAIWAAARTEVRCRGEGHSIAACDAAERCAGVGEYPEEQGESGLFPRLG